MSVVFLDDLVVFKQVQCKIDFILRKNLEHRDNRVSSGQSGMRKLIKIVPFTV